MSDEKQPIVSIGMPAYNSARTLHASIDCLLNQTYRDFELIVSDNGSTDETWSIIQEYAKRDSRVIGIRQPHNIGANGNYTAVFLAAKGRYFKWASSNDWCAPGFLACCVEYLEANPDVALATPRTRLFVETLADARDYQDDISLDSANRVERFIQLSKTLALNNMMNGVVRKEVLSRTPLIEHYPGADVVLVGHIALLGKAVLLPEYLFYRRMDSETATALMSKEARERHHYPGKTSRALFPSWRFLAGWFRAVWSARLSFSETRRAFGWVLHMAYWRHADLRHDLISAFRYALRSS